MRLLVLAFLASASGCSDGDRAGAGGGTGTTIIAPSCRLASALHEHQLTSSPAMRARSSDVVVGRLETATSSAAPGDSGSIGVDVLPYWIDRDGDFELAVGPGTVAAVRLRDDAGRVIAEVARAADAASGAARVQVARGAYTLELDSDGSRDGHYLVLPRACADRSAARARAALDHARSDVDTPGAYAQEIGAGSQTVVGASTGVVAIVGQIGSGSIGTPAQLFDASDLTTTFGASAVASPVGIAVAQFFANGGAVAWVVGTASGSANDVVGDAGSGTGLHALANVADWSLLVLPDLATMAPSDAVTVLSAAVPLAIHANAFTIIDAPASLVAAGDVGGWVIDALVPALPGPLLPDDVLPFAATYFPQLLIEDDAGAQSTVPAGGAIAGMLSTSDAQNGVWVSPSGSEHGVLAGVVGPAQVVDAADAAALLMDRVNPIRAGASVGAAAPAVASGARTLGEDDTNGAFVSASRTDLYLRASIATSLQWVVFDQIDAQLWKTVEQQVSSFLQEMWQSGGLTGATPADAFVVQCDASNNPIEDVVGGVLNVGVEVQIAGNVDPTYLYFSITTPVAGGA